MPRIPSILMAAVLLVPATSLVIEGQSPAVDPGPRGVEVGAGAPIAGSCMPKE